jgi:predicted transposase YdaD
VQHRRGPRPFDVTTSFLIESFPDAWLACAGLPVDGPARVVESDVSMVLAEVDKVIRVDAASPWLAHLELQLSRDRALPLRLLQYHVLLLRRHELPVASVVILLRPEADGPELSGRLDWLGPRGQATISFTYDVIRIWEHPAEEFLQHGLGTLPLAPLAAVEQERLPEIMRRIEERIAQEAPPQTAYELRASTFTLLGLRYDDDVARQLVRGMITMRESATYQAILEEGRDEGRAVGRNQTVHDMLLAGGRLRFGPPDALILAALDVLTASVTPEEAARRLVQAASWADIVALADNPA